MGHFGVESLPWLCEGEARFLLASLGIKLSLSGGGFQLSIFSLETRFIDVSQLSRYSGRVD